MRRTSGTVTLVGTPVARTAPELRIEPAGRWNQLDFGELWSYRELLYFLVWRDLKVRYKQTTFGAAWAVIQPFLSMVVFSLFFGEFARIPSDGVPYPVFAFAGLVPWTYFANAVSGAGNSVVAEERLITKVYFPRTLIPLARVAGGLVDFGIALLVLFAMMAFYRTGISAAILVLPALIALAALAATGLGLWAAALSVRYRDVRYTVPFIMQVLLFATPVAYPSSIVPEAWRALYGINPMVGVIEGFRWCLLGTPRPAGAAIGLSIGAALVLVISGAMYFKRAEDSFADII